jgi:membrane protein
MDTPQHPAIAVAERLTEPVKKVLKSADEASLNHRGLATLRYLMRTEVHTYAFSVAANAILAFFPFIVLLMTLTRKVFRSPVMYDVVVQLLRDFLPAGQDFIVRNLSVLVNARKGVQVASLLILLFTSSGVFLPLEVALNRVWGIKKNRSYLGNQIISLGLAFAVGLLTLISIALTAGNHLLIDAAFADNSILARTLTSVVTKVFAMAASISIFFLIYWLLPNAKIPARCVMPAALAAGVLWEGAKYVYIFALPWLDFKEVYGPFALSVTLMFWAFLSGLLLLGGAFLSAESAENDPIPHD